MAGLTQKEQERLDQLLAKKEAAEKHDAEFFKEVRKRSDEVKKELGIGEPDTYYEDRLGEVAEKYGLTKMGLLDYIETDQQIGYYQRTHKTE